MVELASMRLSFREESLRAVSVRLWTEALPRFGLQLWYAKVFISDLATLEERIIQFEIPDVPAPGNWNHLTARFFARYPDIDRYGETFRPPEHEIRQILEANRGE